MATWMKFQSGLIVFLFIFSTRRDGAVSAEDPHALLSQHEVADHGKPYKLWHDNSHYHSLRCGYVFRFWFVFHLVSIVITDTHRVSEILPNNLNCPQLGMLIATMEKSWIRYGVFQEVSCTVVHLPVYFETEKLSEHRTVECNFPSEGVCRRGQKS